VKLSAAITEANSRAMELHGLRLKNDERSRVAAALFAIAQQHHTSILLLLNNREPLHASAFSLLRLLVETTIRGVWVMHCATEEQERNVIEGNKKQLDTASMFAAIEEAIKGSSGRDLPIKDLYDKHWKVLSAYTHSYEQRVQRWLATKDIEPTYSTEETEELVLRSNLIARLGYACTQSLVEGKDS
jgi:hypothetical protein